MFEYIKDGAVRWKVKNVVPPWTWIVFVIMVTFKTSGKVDIPWLVVFLPIAWSAYLFILVVGCALLGAALAGLVYAACCVAEWIMDVFTRWKRERYFRGLRF